MIDLEAIKRRMEPDLQRYRERGVDDGLIPCLIISMDDAVGLVEEVEVLRKTLDRMRRCTDNCALCRGAAAGVLGKGEKA